MQLESQAGFKVVLIFNLKPGCADEELRRSSRDDSFPSRLARQPGFVEMDLVKVNEERTMSIQTWRSASDWWGALNSVKAEPAKEQLETETILVSRDFFAGEIIARR